MLAMNILYYPIDVPENKYIEISQGAIRAAGYSISKCAFELRNFRRNAKADIAIFNWMENLNDCNNSFSTQVKICHNKLLILLLRAHRVKIVQTFHNLQPHIMNSYAPKAAVRYIGWLYRKADKIIILSRDSKQYLTRYLPQKRVDKKAYYLPHPNYIGAYPVADNLMNKKRESFHILFFGCISEYKNADLIMRVADYFSDENIMFHLYGKCVGGAENQIKQEMQKSRRNVDFQIGYVPDSKVTDIITQSDILLLPYEMSSSMNSGTVILAFSNKRTVICPEICTVKEFRKEDIFSYSYDSEKEHLEKVIASVNRAYSEWNQDYNHFLQHGERLFRQVETDNSLEVITQGYQGLFQELSGKEMKQEGMHALSAH